jgi:hypothetical protein
MKHIRSVTIVLAVLLSPVILPAQKKDSADACERPFQVSFVTPLGTNGIDAFKITNKVSLNILVGVSKGLDGFEAGGLVNVVLKDVKGVQFAGFSNVVVGSVKGSQFAGYANYCGSDFKGAAFAGFCNFNLGELHGSQIAGAFNFNKNGGKGLQLAGHTNVTLGNFKGTQIAGFSNFATGNIEGNQVSGFLNYAKKVKGVQLGFINIADSVDGASIGFLNFVKNGIHQIEFSGDELFYANLSYRMGSTRFYNIFSLGLQPGSKENAWQFGYGAGTSFKVKGKLRSDLSLTAHHVSTGNFYFGTSELCRLYAGLEYRIAKKFSIAAGPTFNLYVSDTLLPDYLSKQKDLIPYHMIDHTNSNDFNIKGWIGGRVALRFL